MSFTRSLIERRATKIAAAGLANPPLWMREFFGGGSATASGISVDEERAMRYITVYACVTLRSDTAASLPFPVYRRLHPRGRERAPEHRLYSLLHDEPNPEMSSYTFWGTQVMHRDLWGDSFAEIEWGNDGWPKALWPIPPKRVRIERHKATKEKVYFVSQPGGGPEVPLFSEQVLHVPGYSFDGVRGLSPIGLAREAVALGLATEEFGGRFFSNDAAPGAFLKHPKELSDKAYARLRERFENKHRGLSKSHRFTILEEGMDIARVGIPPADAQFIDTRKYQKGDIYALYRTPPHMVGDTERSTSWGTGIESMSIGFVTYTMQSSILVPIERAVNRQLVPREQRKEIYAEFLVDGLLRSDAKTRAEVNQIKRANGVINSDEWREQDNQNPLEDGSGGKYFVPLNWVPLDEAKARPAKGAAVAGEQVQAQALNGAQIGSLLEVLQQVTTDDLAPETAAGLLKASFPSLTEAEIGRMVDSAAAFEPPPDPKGVAE